MSLAKSSAVYTSAISIGIEFLDHLFPGGGKRNFAVRFWDGSSWGKLHQPQFTLILRHPGALRSMFISPNELALGEAYIYNDFDIEGDIEAALAMGEHLLQRSGFTKRFYLWTLLGQLPATKRPRAVPKGAHPQGSLHSVSRDRQAIHFHYDLPAEFYELFLGRSMVYSCAYFRNQQQDLSTAQEAKLDYICRKLRLKPGDSFLDIGCGWGALITHAARHYGVRAIGVTLSQSQAEIAQARIAEAGLSETCKAELCDYREIDAGLHFSKIASVGMFEHVGEKMLPTYFDKVLHLLRPGGVFLNHGIAYSATYHRNGPSFTDRYVFPDGSLVPISTTARIAEHVGFEVRDVENLREHYAITLHHWVKNLESHAAEARQLTDDTTYRIWRLYMAGSAFAFRIGRLNLFQTLLSKPIEGCSALPLTRQDWYAGNGRT